VEGNSKGKIEKKSTRFWIPKRGRKRIAENDGKRKGFECIALSLIVLRFGFCEQRNRRRDLWISTEVTETLYLLQFIVCLLCVFVLVSCLDFGKKSMALEYPSDFLGCTFRGWRRSCPRIYRARGRCGLRGWNKSKI
jgi:hypothetical protein